MNSTGKLGVLCLCAVAPAWVGGCTDREKELCQLQAFLQKPRSPVSAAEYHVYPPDVLSITSVHVPEINGHSQQVRPDGAVNLPLLGPVEVAGKTPAEIEKAIMTAAEDYYERVDARVQVTGYNSQKVFVLGQVASSGAQPWTGRDTVLDVVARARPTFLAWPEKIRVFRSKAPARGGYMPATRPADDEREEPTAEQVQEMTVDLMAMMESGDLSRNVMLRPDDLVYVPPNPFAKVGLALRTVLYPVRPTLEAIRVPRTFEDAAGTGQDDND